MTPRSSAAAALVVAASLLCANAVAHAWPPAAEVASATPCDAAQAFVSSAAASEGLRVEMRCDGRLDAASKPGDGDWKLAAPVPMRSGAARVVLTARAGQKERREVAVPVWLSVHSAGWVASRALDAGEAVRPGDLHLQEIEWPVGVQPVAAPAEQPLGRAKVALRAGDWIGSSLLPADEGVQGDPVTVQLHDKGVTVEAPGLLLADTRVGRTARVQLVGQRAVLEGQLVNLSTVVVGR